MTEKNYFLNIYNTMTGEFELEAMAQGAVRVLSGQEEAKEYTAAPVWDIHDITKA